MNKTLLAVAVGSLVLLADFATKYAATLFFEPPVAVIPNVFSLVLHHNPGLAFSVPMPNLLQIVLSVGLLFGLAFYWKSEPRTTFETMALAAIVGGAFGNLAERILFGSVTDFFAVWSFPVFNIADSAISLGVMALIGHELFGRSGRTASNNEQKTC